MSDESGIQPFRLFGEDAPGWLVWGLALLGMAGIVATAQQLVPLLEKEFLPYYLGQIAGNGGSKGQLRPMRGLDANAPVGRKSTEDREQVPGSDKSASEDPAFSPVSRVEPGPGSIPSGTIPAPSPDATGSDLLPPRNSLSLSAALDESLGPIPDLLTELRLPGPPSETSTSGQNLDGPPTGADSENVRGGMPDTRISQPASDNGREPSSATPTPDPNPPALASDGGSEKPTAVAALPDQVDGTTGDCAPVFAVTFPSGGVKPVASDLDSKVKRLADWLRRNPAVKLYLEGHTDGAGDEEFNLILSHRRATAIGELLAQAGVATEQLSTLAYGESMLIDPRPHSARNRRVSMRVADGNECLPMAEDHER